jgi:hypothetical protein
MCAEPTVSEPYLAMNPADKHHRYTWCNRMAGLKNRNRPIPEPDLEVMHSGEMGLSKASGILE